MRPSVTIRGKGRGGRGRVRSGKGKPGKSWSFNILIKQVRKTWKIKIGHGKLWKIRSECERNKAVLSERGKQLCDPSSCIKAMCFIK